MLPLVTFSHIKSNYAITEKKVLKSNKKSSNNNPFKIEITLRLIKRRLATLLCFFWGKGESKINPQSNIHKTLTNF